MEEMGASHTENIFKGLPSHLRGSKIVKEAISSMTKDKWLIAMKKTREIHYALNPEKVEEIMRFYEEKD